MFVFVFQALLSISTLPMHGAGMAGSSCGGRGCPASRNVLAEPGCSRVLVPASPACAVSVQLSPQPTKNVGFSEESGQKTVSWPFQVKVTLC